MNCQNCGYDVPAGQAFCPNCGTPVTSQSIPPTVAASQPSFPTPPAPYGASSPSYPAYNAPSTDYGAPQQTPPYSAPQQTPYGDQQAQPYGGMPAQPYGAPPQPYGAPLPYGAPGTYAPQQPPKKKANGCLIAAVIVIALFVLVVGGIIAAVAVTANKVGHAVTNISATANADLTAAATYGTSTTTNTGGVPTASQIDPNALLNIPTAQTASNVDSNDNPVDNQKDFSIGDTVYIAVTFTGVKAGYAETKLYKDGEFDISSKVLAVDASPSPGYFSFTIGSSASFVAGVYWCTTADCSDAALADVVSFTAS